MRGGNRVRPGWTGSNPDRWGSNHAFTNPRFPGVVVQHCGHPTANYPWCIEGADVPGCFAWVGQAQDAVEAVLRGDRATTIEGPLFAP